MYRDHRLSQMKAVAFEWGRKPHGRGAPLEHGGRGGEPAWGAVSPPASLPSRQPAVGRVGCLGNSG